MFIFETLTTKCTAIYFRLRKKRQLVLRYARNDSSLPLLKYISVAKYSHRTSPQWNQLTDALCYFIVRDMQPFDTVNDSGFQHILREFEPCYVPPDRKTIPCNYMPCLFAIERTKDRVRQQLSGITNFAVTTDIWTSRAKHAYTGLTVH